MEHIQTLAKDMAIVPVTADLLEQMMSTGLNGFKAVHGLKNIKIISGMLESKDRKFYFVVSSPSIDEYMSYVRIALEAEPYPGYELPEKIEFKTIVMMTGKNIGVALTLPVIDLTFEDLKDGERLPTPIWGDKNEDSNSDSGCNGDCGSCGGMHQSYDDDEEDIEEDEGTRYGKDPDEFFPPFEGNLDDWRLT